jgi:hypothetical protein
MTDLLKTHLILENIEQNRALFDEFCDAEMERLNAIQKNAEQEKTNGISKQLAFQSS